MRPDSQPGLRPVWNWLAVAFAVGVLVVMFAPAAPVGDDETTTTTSTPGRTITLDELRAMLTDSPGEPLPSFEVDTPSGPVTVVVPATTAPPQTTTTSTTTAPPATTTTTSTTTTTVAPPRPPLPSADDILDQLIGNGHASPPVTLPEVVGDGQ